MSSQGKPMEAGQKLRELRQQIQSAIDNFLNGGKYVLTYSEIVYRLEEIEAALAASSGASAGAQVTGEQLRKLAYEICGLGPDWMLHTSEGKGTRWDKLAEALNAALARQSQVPDDEIITIDEDGKVTGLIETLRKLDVTRPAQADAATQAEGRGRK
jgi:hypothetical protein